MKRILIYFDKLYKWLLKLSILAAFIGYLLAFPLLSFYIPFGAFFSLLVYESIMNYIEERNDKKDFTLK